MPRKSNKARRKPNKKKIHIRFVKLVKAQDDGISPGRIVACAEYIPQGEII